MADKLARIKGRVKQVHAAGMFEKPAIIEAAFYEVCDLLGDVIETVEGRDNGKA